MPDQQAPNTETRATQRAASRQHAARQWRALGERMLEITPRGLARFTLVLGAVLGLIWLVRASWPATLPFMIGFAIAYAALPVVNALDRVMPRLIASLLATGAVVAGVIVVPVLILRPIVIELNRAYQQLPSNADIQRYVDRINQRIDTWPEPIQNFVRSELQETIVSVRDRIDARVSGIDGLAFDALLGIINAVGLFLGILVLPVWIHMILRDQRAARGAINRGLPDWLEADFWAVVGILDRSVGRYVRGLALLGLSIGVATFAGLVVLRELGFEVARYPLALAVVAGLLELIPTFGPILSLLIAALVGLRAEPAMAPVVVALYIGIRLIVRRLLAARLDQALVDIHPAILAVVLVVLSQFGLIWALLAAPVTALARDLYRYTWGRLGDPARPAGLLPGMPLPAAAARAGGASAARPERRVPLVYQRRAMAAPVGHDASDNGAGGQAT
jgi:predicted PurR-regulated permease PerM